MRAFIHSEPELEFGGNCRHVDVRFGIRNFGPADLQTETAPQLLRIGLVGTSETISGFTSWVDRCRIGITEKKSNKPNLFPAFPGFSDMSPFLCEVQFPHRGTRTLINRKIDALASLNKYSALKELAHLFFDEIKYIADETNADVTIVAIPASILISGYDAAPEWGGEGKEKILTFDFRDYLKSLCMHLSTPIQLITPPTYTGKAITHNNKQKRSLQDEATRAWNFFTALYYKGKGVPWRILREAYDLTTCYIGVSFFNTLDRSTVQASVAQVFNERGEGVVVRGGPAVFDKDDRQIHLDAEQAKKLILNALAAYRQEHKTFPARVVVHKSSLFNENERTGMLSALEECSIESSDLLSIGHCDVRAFRHGAYPVLRGLSIQLSEMSSILYTYGSMQFYQTYPGMYVPEPLLLNYCQIDSSMDYLEQEILTLTKMNWNNTQCADRLPITLVAANKVKSVLRFVPNDLPVASGYRYYM